MLWRQQGSDPRNPNEEVIQEQVQASVYNEIGARIVEVTGRLLCIMGILTVLKKSLSVQLICFSTAGSGKFMHLRRCTAI